MAPHSSILAWKIPWMEEPGRLQSMGLLESDTTERLHFHFSLSCTGEGNGNPLQCSCLENPRDGGAWWAAIYGVAQSRTRLKRLSSSSSSSLRESAVGENPSLLHLTCVCHETWCLLALSCIVPVLCPSFLYVHALLFVQASLFHKHNSNTELWCTLMTSF